MHNLVMSEDDMQYIILLWKFTKKQLSYLMIKEIIYYPRLI